MPPSGAYGYPMGHPCGYPYGAPTFKNKYSFGGVHTTTQGTLKYEYQNYYYLNFYIFVLGEGAGDGLHISSRVGDGWVTCMQAHTPADSHL